MQDATSPDVIVEAFPRTGNTYLAAAISALHPTARILSHHHDPKILREASGLVPVLSPIRNPIDAITSNVVRMTPSGRSEDRLKNSIKNSAEHYTEMLTAAINNPYVQIVSFEEICSDVLSIIERLIDPKLGPARLATSNEELYSRISTELHGYYETSTQDWTREGNMPRDLDPEHPVIKRLVESYDGLEDLQELYTAALLKKK